MITDFNIYNFIETYGITPLRETGTITSITNVGDGSYKIYAVLTNLFAGCSVTLSGCGTSFNGIYEVYSLSSNYFTVKRKWNSTTYSLESLANNVSFSVSGAKWTLITPTFYHDRPDRLNEILNQYQNDLQKYPTILLFEPLNRQYIRETVGSYDLIINNLQIAFVQKIIDNWNRNDYESNIFLPMRQLAMNFIDSLDSTFESNQTYSEIITDFTLNDYFSIIATTNANNNRNVNNSAFDFRAGGVILNFNLKIVNAGKICYND